MKQVANTENDTLVGKYVITRGYRSGVHCGEYGGDAGGWITLRASRRIWYWSGAASLSELAVYGCRGKDSKIGVELAEIRIQTADVSEILVCQPAGESWLREVPSWRA
jgi:hypothetical protein